MELDLTGWLEYFVHGLATQLAEIRTRGEIAISSDVIAQAHNLNPRQAAILDAIAAEPDLGIRQIGDRVDDLNRRTLQRDLRKLVDLGLIAELGSSPTDPSRRYRINPEALRSCDKL